MAAQNQYFSRTIHINNEDPPQTQKKKSLWCLISCPESNQDVYHRLMDDLEDEEDPLPWTTILRIAIELVIFVGLVAALVCTLNIPRIKRQSLLTLPPWEWVVLVMVFISGLPAIRFLTFVALAPARRWWRVHKYVVYFAGEIKGSMDVTLWFGLVLVAWYLWFRPRLRDVKGDASMIVCQQTTRLLIALVLGSFLWLLKKLLYLKLKADLHYDQLFDRIQRTVLDFHGIQIIYKEGQWKYLRSQKNKRKQEAAKKMEGNVRTKRSPSNQGEQDISLGKNIWMDVHNMKNETAPIWILKKLAHNYLKQMKDVGLPRNRDTIKDDRKLMAEAKEMLKLVIQEQGRNDYILPEDLDKYDLKEDERSYLFTIFSKEKGEEEPKDNQQPQKITRAQFLSWAVVAYKNCWGLERTLCSSERVFIKLNRIMSTFLLSVVLIIWLLLSRMVETGQLALLFTPFLAASFIFGDTCKKMFEGLIFAFAMHPFDVGDRVIIENVQMKVSRLNILTSVFFKYDTGEEVVYPNSLLSGTKIINLDIIPDQADCLEFTLLPNTPMEDITDLEHKIKKDLDEDIKYSSQTKVVKKELGREEIKMAVNFKYLVSYLAAETKTMYRSYILGKIMEFKTEMESNNKRLSSCTYDQVVLVHFILRDTDSKLDQINELKTKISEIYKAHYGKLLITSVDKGKIKMGLHLMFTDDSKDRETFEQELSKIKRNQVSDDLLVSQVLSLGRKMGS